MQKRIFYAILCLAAITLMLVTSCTPETTSTPSTATPTPAATSTATPQADWWDKFGEPQYGDTLHLLSNVVPSWDPNEPMFSSNMFHFEYLFQVDWTLDPDVYKPVSHFCPAEYTSGLLAESWEMKDDSTVIVKLKEGIHWQDKAPVNGRELTAYDVEYSWQRILGTGHGFTEMNMFWFAALSNVEQVTATDDYTVEFTLKQPGALGVYQILAPQVFYAMCVVPHEWVEQGDTQNWQNAVGSGPFLLSDHQVGVATTFTRNPDYWGYDERHPENQLPYFDEVKLITIPDLSTSLAALRSGQIDIIATDRGGPSMQQAASLAKTNPEILQDQWPGNAVTLDIRCDVEPFTDIEVRKAMQLAIDLEAIAESIYLGQVDGKPAGIIQSYLTGWTLPYDEWPADLQAEYTYNPEKAIEMLAEAGYPDGFETNLVGYVGTDMEVAEAMKAMLLDIGIDMEIEVMDQTALRTYLRAFKHEALSLSARSSFPYAPDWALGCKTSKDAENATHNNDAYYDDLVLNQIPGARTMEEAMQLTTKADMYYLSQHWAVHSCVCSIPVVWQSYLMGYSGESLGCRGWQAQHPARLWIDQELKESIR